MPVSALPSASTLPGALPPVSPGGSPPGLPRRQAELGWRWQVRPALLALGGVSVWLGGLLSVAATVGWWVWCFRVSWISALVIATLASFHVLGAIALWASSSRGEVQRWLPLPEGAEPRLVELVAEVSAELGLPRPPRLLLAPGFEAFALLGSAPMVVLGAALIDCADRSSLKAVIGHECGHLQVSARSRALVSDFMKSHAALLRGGWMTHLAVWPFELWGIVGGLLLTRLRHLEERFADECAHRVAPEVHLPSVLATLVARSASFASYRGAVLDMALTQGLLPPWLEGYRTFRESAVARSVERAADTPHEISFFQPHGHHSRRGVRPHPPRSAPPAPLSWDGRYEWANRLGLEHWLGLAMGGGRLRPATFDEVGRLSQIPRYRRQLERSTGFRGVTLESAPAHAALAREDLPALDPDAPETYAVRGAPISRRLCVALHDAGWDLSYTPGLPMTFRRGSVSVIPDEVARALLEDESARQAWPAFLAALGLPGVPAAPPSAARPR